MESTSDCTGGADCTLCVYFAERRRDEAFTVAFFDASALPPASLFRAIGGRAGVALEARNRLRAAVRARYSLR